MDMYLAHFPHNFGHGLLFNVLKFSAVYQTRLFLALAAQGLFGTAKPLSEGAICLLSLPFSHYTAVCSLGLVPTGFPL